MHREYQYVYQPQNYYKQQQDIIKYGIKTLKGLLTSRTLVGITLTSTEYLMLSLLGRLI